MIDETDILGISAISCWEVALLSKRRRVDLHGDIREWLDDLFIVPGLEIVPLTPDITVRAAEYHKLLRDPADCLITATAAVHDAPLVTKDQRIRDSGLVETIW